MIMVLEVRSRAAGREGARRDAFVVCSLWSPLSAAVWRYFFIPQQDESTRDGENSFDLVWINAALWLVFARAKTSVTHIFCQLVFIVMEFVSKGGTELHFCDE